MNIDKFSTKEKEIRHLLPWHREHEALLVLVPKYDAENSYEARKLVLLNLEEISGKNALAEYSVGGIFSGLLSDICGDKLILPFYNKEMREVVKKGIDKIGDQIRELVKKDKEANIPASVMKKAIPGSDKYNDADLLDILRREFKDLDIDLSYVVHVKTPSELRTGDIVYRFKPLIPLSEDPTKGYFTNKRYIAVELGYEDDAMIVNKCLYLEVIDKAIEKVIDIYKGPTDITPEIVGKKWLVLVDIY